VPAGRECGQASTCRELFKSLRAGIFNIFLIGKASAAALYFFYIRKVRIHLTCTTWHTPRGEQGNSWVGPPTLGPCLGRSLGGYPGVPQLRGTQRLVPRGGNLGIADPRARVPTNGPTDPRQGCTPGAPGYPRGTRGTQGTPGYPICPGVPMGTPGWYPELAPWEWNSFQNSISLRIAWHYPQNSSHNSGTLF